MVQAESVDVISAGNAATTKGLFESKRNAMGLTVKALCEALVKHPKVKSYQVKPLKALAEMDGMGELPTATDAPPADADEPGDGVKDAFCTAISSIVNSALDGETDSKEALRKIKELIASHEKVKGGKAAPEEEGEEEDEDEGGAVESKGKKAKAADPIGVFSECKKAGYEPTASELRYLCTLTEAELRRAHQRGQGQDRARQTAPDPRLASRRPVPGARGR